MRTQPFARRSCLLVGLMAWVFGRIRRRRHLRSQAPLPGKIEIEWQRGMMNKFEQIEAEKDGLDIVKEIPTFAQQAWEAITEADLERLKWAGVFFRKHAPGFFMMRVRITNGMTVVTQLRTLAALAAEFGHGRLDITTRQQIQLRWLRIQDIPTVLARLAEVGLTSLQTGMDNIRNVV